MPSQEKCVYSLEYFIDLIMDNHEEIEIERNVVGKMELHSLKTLDLDYDNK